MRNSGNIVAQVVRPSPLVGEGCAGLASFSELSRSWVRGSALQARSAQALKFEFRWNMRGMQFKMDRLLKALFRVRARD